MNKKILVIGIIVFVVGIGIGYVIKPAPPTAIPITARMSWVMQGRYAPYFVALEKGWYAEEGLSVSIYRGFGSNATITSVSEGKDQFGEAGFGSVQTALTKGSNVKIVAIEYKKSLVGLAFFERSGINNPKDLEGKKIALAPFDTTFTLWDAFANANGIDTSKVEIVNVSTDLYLTSLFEGTVDVIGSFGDAFPKYQLIAAGQGQPELAWMGFADWGLNAYDQAIIVNSEFMNDNPDVVRRFLRASFKGIQYAKENPEEALSILKKYNPEISENSERAFNEVAIPNLSSDGIADPELLQSSLDIYEAALGLQTTITPEQIYTSEFLD